jgi:hypothetical protein
MSRFTNILKDDNHYANNFTLNSINSVRIVFFYIHFFFIFYLNFLKKFYLCVKSAATNSAADLQFYKMINDQDDYSNNASISLPLDNSSNKPVTLTWSNLNASLPPKTVLFQKCRKVMPPKPKKILHNSTIWFNLHI